MSNKGAGAQPQFQLLETMLWEPERGYFLLEAHLRRLGEAAVYFDFAVDTATVRQKLQTLAGSLPMEPHRVRLLVAAEGGITAQAFALGPARDPGPWRVALATQPVQSTDPFLRHKTTRRQVYQAARAAYPHLDEVLLWNERGELTEGTIANVVVQMRGEWLTPPLACGLLPGTFRAQLLLENVIREQVIAIDDLPGCEGIYLINSVRRWVEGEMTSDK
jgi:para-aminobenzoate synthetase/4-amino-4-deoxychorismate lyase